MKYTKEQLIEMVKPYFKKDKVELLYVTEDNQVFYPNCKVQASSHARVYKLRAPFEITRADVVVEKTKQVIEKPKKADKVDSDKEALIEIAKEMGVKVDKRMSVENIEKLIKEKEDARE